MGPDARLGSSFRDPSGFLFTRDGTLYRQVNQTYRENYDTLMSSGLYEALTKTGQLIPHDEVDVPPPEPAIAYRIIAPQRVAFISYPYEWPFSALKAAALATLEIQEIALEHGMILKDASAYNIQFVHANPVLIDTLSFEAYVEGEPWIAYRQFCQHFLAPLALMARKDVRMNHLLRIYIDGIPLDLASRLLPRSTYLTFGIGLHIHAHARSQKKYAEDHKTTGAGAKLRKKKVSRQALRGIVDNLKGLVKRLRWEPTGTEWGAYYEDTNYTQDALEDKKRIVQTCIERIRPRSVWDLGANTGVFSRIASEMDIDTVAFDIDPAAVEKNFLACSERGDRHLLPLLLDLANPSPAIGWNNRERDALIDRGPVDAILALALIHHLAIANNVPLDLAAEFFARLCQWLIIEFVPKSDSQVERLLATREDIFPEFTEEGFEAAFKKYFTIEDQQPVKDSRRILYLMRKI